MNRLENTKTVASLSDDITTSATHSMEIDTLGFKVASIDVAFEKVAAAGTNSAVALVLKLQHGDSTSSYSDLTGYVGGTSFTIPTPANTTSDVVVRFDVDLRGKKRYLKVVATGNATGSVYSVARLGKPEDGPDTATEKGASVAVVG
jgi:beta-mannanase